CARVFTKFPNLKSHWRCHLDNQFACALCDAEFKRRPDLYRHCRSVHVMEAPHMCDRCGKRFARAD
ncbi:hypothetical protein CAUPRSCDRAFT_2544, partial [Caulochytrium protostelioides]